MVGLENVVDELRKAGIPGDLWIDGSFLTEKIDAEDVDVVLRVSGTFADAATAEQLGAMSWLNSNLKGTHKVDSYIFAEWPDKHPHFWIGEYNYAYWLKQFGFSRGHDRKGIAVLELAVL